MKLTGSVRTKLLTLVALPVLMMGATLPILGWVLDRQLVDEVDDRVVDARKSLQGELDDDLAALRLTVRVLAADPDLYRALDAHDAKAATDLARIFGSVYPEVQVILAEPGGRVLAAVGPIEAPGEVGNLLGPGDGGPAGERVLLARAGCGREQKGPARVVAARAGVSGYVLVCQPLDTKYTINAADKLGLELAIVPRGGREPLARTPGFPLSSLATARAEATLLAGPTSWAVARFQPSWGGASTARSWEVEVVAALDVTDIKTIVRRNLTYALVLLLLGALSCILVGARVAMVMSQALGRISFGVRKLADQEYVKVEIRHTGDELEDLANGFNTMVDGLRERDKLRSTMGKYMTPALISHLMAGEVELGGKTLEVTILFTDIRSFTSISETMKAHDLVSLLNEYFSEMVGVVLAHDGAVDKYIGDAIMAVFGAPIPGPKDAENAVRAAVEMRRKLSLLNESLVARGLAPLRTGIGIHTGEVVAGNIGSEARMEYTVIGDAVNLASRLESNTKDMGVDVLISAATYERTRHIVDARPVREISVKGRAQPVMTYEVLGLLPPSSR
jgi:adenylate cyclase